MAAKGISAEELTGIVINPEEYEIYLKKAFEDSGIQVPKDDKGKEKILQPEEIKTLLKESITITENDLRILATERAANVKDYILNDDRITPERVFVLEPGAPPEEITEEIKLNRVNFIVK